jgi:hypothetical protein
MVAAQPGDRRHPVEEGHVQVDHGGIDLVRVGQFDCLQPIDRRGHDGELRLPVDQRAQRLEKQHVVVRDEHFDRALRRSSQNDVRRWGAIGECDARTQEVSRAVALGTSEDAAACR